MPDRQPPKSKARTASFRVRYDALEARRNELMERLAVLSAKVGPHPAHGRARTLLGTTFRKASLAQRTAVLEAASWLITVLDRAASLV